MDDIEQLRAKLTQYETNLKKVNELLLKKKDDEKLIQLRQDLEKVIDLTRKLIKNTEDDDVHAAEQRGNGTLSHLPEIDFEEKQKKKKPIEKEFAVGSRVEVEHNGHWYAAVIENMGYDTSKKDTKYTLRWIINNKEETVIGIDGLRSIKRTKGELDLSKLKLGARCIARYSEDGNWYKASILEINKYGCLVHYMDYGNRERVPFEYIADLKDKTEFDDPLHSISSGSNVPEHLRLLPTDSETIRKNKKRKLKSLKRQADIAVQDHLSEKRQNSWQSFKAKKEGKRSMKKKSIFAVEEVDGSLAGKVGVIGSSAKMSELVTKRERLAWN